MFWGLHPAGNQAVANAHGQPWKQPDASSDCAPAPRMQESPCRPWEGWTLNQGRSSQTSVSNSKGCKQAQKAANSGTTTTSVEPRDHNNAQNTPNNTQAFSFFTWHLKTPYDKKKHLTTQNPTWIKNMHIKNNKYIWAKKCKSPWTNVDPKTTKCSAYDYTKST